MTLQDLVSVNVNWESKIDDTMSSFIKRKKNLCHIFELQFQILRTENLMDPAWVHV